MTNNRYLRKESAVRSMVKETLREEFKMAPSELPKAKEHVIKVLKDVIAEIEAFDVDGKYAKDKAGKIALNIQYANRSWQDSIRGLLAAGVDLKGMTTDATPRLVGESKRTVRESDEYFDIKLETVGGVLSIDEAPIGYDEGSVSVEMAGLRETYRRNRFIPGEDATPVSDLRWTIQDACENFEAAIAEIFEDAGYKRP